ncbi:MAG: glutamine--tRNA ligase [Betaproteobacteria bacterium]|nr:glutamine--tRNA ligase [Betaproteobacteria bacterium]
MAEPSPPKAAAAPHFIRAIIDHDLASGRLNHRSWAGFPSDARQAANQADQATIRTRFPPEPNGYLHIGHAKSICLNFGLAKHYGGRCHMRFDDTNPVKEDQEFVDSILDTVSWLGFSWEHEQEKNLYYASDYFQSLFDCAEYLIKASHAYVDEQSPEDMRARRGSLTEPGEDSPFRDRPAEESLRRFREMRAGKHAEGSMVLRARIDMRSPNLNMRDPALYRIRFAEHHRTGNQWCIYPMYDYAHPISDALENITHSLCTLEFEDHRPFYDWVLERLAEGGFLRRPLPQQTEFARLNLYYTVTSKRKLQELVSSGRVKGWDDPRMPTLVGLRRRGFTPESIQLFCERIGVSKANQWVDPSVLDIALRDDLETKAKRATAVIDPTAKIGKDVAIGPGAVISAEAIIGDRANIDANAVIYRGVTIGEDSCIGSSSTISHAIIGNRVLIHRGVHIGQDGFGFALGRVVIEDDVEIGSGTTIDRGTGPDTFIGEGTKIDNLVMIGHNVNIGRRAVIIGQCGISGSTRIGDGAMLAGQAGIAGHLKIGAGAKIAAKSGVMNDIPPGASFGGTPAMPVVDWHRQTIALQRLIKPKRGANE